MLLQSKQRDRRIAAETSASKLQVEAQNEEEAARRADKERDIAEEKEKEEAEQALQASKTAEVREFAGSLRFSAIVAEQTAMGEVAKANADAASKSAQLQDAVKAAGGE